MSYTCTCIYNNWKVILRYWVTVSSLMGCFGGFFVEKSGRNCCGLFDVRSLAKPAMLTWMHMSSGKSLYWFCHWSKIICYVPRILVWSVVLTLFHYDKELYVQGFRYRIFMPKLLKIIFSLFIFNIQWLTKSELDS